MSGALTSLTDALRRMDLSWEAHVEKTLQTSSTAQVEYCPSPGGILDPFEPDDNGAWSHHQGDDWWIGGNMTWEVHVAQNLEHEARTAPALDEFFKNVLEIESTCSWDETYIYPRGIRVHHLVHPTSGRIWHQFFFSYRRGYVERG